MLRVALPWLRMPPPLLDAELPERVELVTVRVPLFLKAPPLPKVFAPVTVTPETERLLPVLMVKILKLPWLASMVSEEARRPVIVSVPAVLVVSMLGRAAARVMV